MRSVHRRVAVWAAALPLFGVSACSSCAQEVEEPSIADAAAGAISDAGARDAQGAQDAQLELEAAPPAGPPKRLFASRYVARIRNAPRKGAEKLGYMRAGAVTMATTAEPIGYHKCRKGWFELAEGGYVCSTQDVIPFMGTRYPERRPLQPDLEARLPYPYGYSRAQGTPVYRRLPSQQQAARFEGYRVSAAGDSDAGVEDAADAAVPTLASLMGSSDSVLLRRMERGFYVSLDREMTKGDRRYWRTQANGFIPHKRLRLVEGSEFSGVALVDGGPQLPLGVVLSSKRAAYALDERGRVRRAGKPGYHHGFGVTGEVDLHGRRYLVGDDGLYYRAREVARIDARDPPSEVGPDEKWIDIDLGSQSLVAYEGARPVYATLVSTGRVRNEHDPLRNFKTPTGAFHVRAKHVTTTMEGDHAIDGPYSIEDVPYVMFFYQGGFALHSAFWHNRFGRPRSHGCVNLAPDDARWLFNWSDPQLPENWHGIYASEERPGTRIYIRGETPPG